MVTGGVSIRIFSMSPSMRLGIRGRRPEKISRFNRLKADAGKDGERDPEFLFFAFQATPRMAPLPVRHWRGARADATRAGTIE
jgi:hypothetical protein